MEEEKRKTTEDKIKEIESRLISNSKDAHFAKNLIQQLAGLYQMDKLIDVPLKDVKDFIDMGKNALYRTTKGYVWEAKGGVTTFVEYRSGSPYIMLNDFYNRSKNDNKSDEDRKNDDLYLMAVEFIMQAPFFASVDERALYDDAKFILKTFQEYCTEHYTNAEAPERTEEDYKEDAEAEQAAKALEILAESPLPPED